MNWQAISAIGEMLGGAAVVVTLIYLTIQLRQNTRAVASSTYQAISVGMARNVELMASHPEIAALVLKAQSGLATMAPEDRVCFGFVMVMLFRRIESVYVQRRLGFVDAALTHGFEGSALSTLASAGAREWWQHARPAFSQDFVAWVDAELASGRIKPVHVGFGLDVPSA